MQVVEVLIRRLTHLRRAEPVPLSAAPVATASESPQDEIIETICAPKLQPRRCLNESGHKLDR